MIDHPLASRLAAAANGEFPPADGEVEVHPPAGDSAGAVVAFTGHFVVAAALEPGAVEARAPAGEYSVPLSSSFLEWLGAAIGAAAGVHDMLWASLGTGASAPGWLRSVADSSHTRVMRARRHRRDVRVWTAEGGVLTVGHGFCDRWELAFEVDTDARNRGLGRQLVAAARAVVPAGEPVFAQVAPGNAASVRTMIAAGFTPIGAEVLYHRA